MCCGKHKAAKAPGAKPSDFFIGPMEPCVLCAEKHLSFAWRIAVECGYEETNRQLVIGELQAAIHHLWKENRDLALKVRDIRHLIQQRSESGIDWKSVLVEIDKLCIYSTQKTTPQIQSENENGI